ncbi:hypothetical protein B0H11DRAFT_2252284 [Mycena galericulata]|nr:hypothetical protein B0H11DRAFT_2252284 [Mycena galericulata]
MLAPLAVVEHSILVLSIRPLAHIDPVATAFAIAVAVAVAAVTINSPLVVCTNSTTPPRIGVFPLPIVIALVVTFAAVSVAVAPLVITACSDSSYSGPLEKDTGNVRQREGHREKLRNASRGIETLRGKYRWAK